MTTLIASSVVRGSRQGESHGGVYLLDFENEKAAMPIDWNRGDIDWQGRGWDRGLRGIAFDGEVIYIAASDELFAYDPDFRLLNTFRCPFLRHCHEIHVHQRRLYLTSTGYDSILAFDLDKMVFSWGMHLAAFGKGYKGSPFNPASDRGPAAANHLHINSVFSNDKGLFVSGLNLNALLVYNGRKIQRWVDLPTGTHNARPHRDGVLFNDTRSDRVSFIGREHRCSFSVPHYPQDSLTHVDADDSRVARQAFGRGLCTVSDSLVAAGSSPSTISLHNLDARKTVRSVTLSHDVRNAIHGLEVWPY